MCFGGSKPKSDDRPFRLQQDNAKEARAKEEARQARIDQGSSLLDAMFYGGTATRPDQWAEAVQTNPGAGLGDAKWDVRGGGAGLEVETIPGSNGRPQTGGGGGVRNLTPHRSIGDGQTFSVPGGGRVTVNDNRAVEELKARYAGYGGGGQSGPSTPARYKVGDQTFDTQDAAQAFIDSQKGAGEKTFEGYSPYLEDRRATLLDYYNPQLQEQEGNARDKLRYGLARSGLTRSTTGAESDADLTSAYDRRRAEMLSRVDDDVSSTRKGFEGLHSDLTGMLLQSGDAARVANEATTRLNTLLEDKPTLNPMGDVFGNMVSTYDAYGRGKTNGRVAGIYGAPSIVDRSAYGGGGNSGRIVR